MYEWRCLRDGNRLLSSMAVGQRSQARPCPQKKSSSRRRSPQWVILLTACKKAEQHAPSPPSPPPHLPPPSLIFPMDNTRSRPTSTVSLSILQKEERSPAG